jgi:flagellar protein FlbD
MMIRLTRLGGEPFLLNADLIQYVEARPDTFITLTSGERVVVVESMDEVLRRAVAYQQAKHLVPAPARWPDMGTGFEPHRIIPEKNTDREVPVPISE